MDDPQSEVPSFYHPLRFLMSERTRKERFAFCWAVETEG